LQSSSPHLALHSFPTRRSSDLSELIWQQIKHFDSYFFIESKEIHKNIKLKQSTYRYPTSRTISTSDEKSFELKEESSLKQSSFRDRKSTRLNSSHVSISYAVFC